MIFWSKIKKLKNRNFGGTQESKLWIKIEISDKHRNCVQKIITPFHWPKLKYHFITKNIIESDYFTRNKIHMLRLTKPYIFQLHVYLNP